MKVIAISGHAQNGKDTVAGLIENKLRKQDLKVLVTHYADLLKYICTMFFGWDGNKDAHGRSLLQYVGTDVIRARAPDFWVDFIISILKYFGENWDYVLIPDSRFPNEIDKLKCAGFDVTHMRVVRGYFDNSLTEEQRNHPSETALDNITPNFYIFNTGTLKDLDDTIDDWIKENINGN